MPIVKNKDQTLSLAPESTNTAPQVDFGAFQPQQAPVVQQQQAQAEPQMGGGEPQVDFSVLQTPDVNFDMFSEAKETENLNSALKSTMAEDILGGLATGVFAENFTASAGTTIESMLPDWATGRIEFTDDDGNFKTPEYKSVREYVGIEHDEWESMSAAQRRVAITKHTKEEILKATNADPDNTAFTIANITGMLLDPTTVMPILGSTTKAKAGYSAAVGGTDVGMYETATQGNPTLGGVALGVGLGAGVSLGMSKLLKSGQHGATSPDVRRDAQMKLSKLSDALKAKAETQKLSGQSPTGVYDDTLKEMGLNADDVAMLMRQSGHPATSFASVGETGIIDKFIEPISERLKRISPRLWKNLVEMERKSHEKFHNLALNSDEFIRKDIESRAIRKNPEVARAFKLAMLTDDMETFTKLGNKHFKPGWETRYAGYKAAMDESYAMLKATRGKHANLGLGKKKELYMHRAVKDYKLLRGILGQEERKAIDAKLAKRFPEGATEGQINRMYSDYFNGIFRPKNIKAAPKGIKTRKLTAKMFQDKPELLDAFHDPAKATHSYLKSTVDDSYRKAFFGSKLTGKFGDDLNNELFGELAAKEIKAGRMADDVETTEELKKLLSFRFVDGVTGPDKAIQQFKDLSYSVLLGNPISAITQLGDIAIAAAKYGLRDTMEGILISAQHTAAKAGGKPLRGFTPKEMGLMDTLIEELSSEAKTKGILRFALRGSGFSSVDALGKTVNLNAALAKARRLARTPHGQLKLKAKWGEAFGEDFGTLVKDLQESNIKSPHVRTLVFAELSDVQPITLLEMPEKYLTSNNGRLAYMLRTFQMKYINLLRQKSFKEIGRGNYKEGIVAGALLVSYFTAGGASTDALKNLVLGRDTYTQDLIINNLLKTTGILDKYSIEKLSISQDPMSVTASNLMPPFSVLSPMIVGAKDLALTGEIKERNAMKLVGQIPIIGKILYNFGGGASEYNAKRWEEHT